MRKFRRVGWRRRDDGVDEQGYMMGQWRWELGNEAWRRAIR
jgi:hypothetical protein